jgi:hypothetical protein
VREVIAGEKWNVLIQPIFQGLDERSGFGSGPLADPPHWHDFVHWVKGGPNPKETTIGNSRQLFFEVPARYRDTTGRSIAA